MKIVIYIGTPNLGQIPSAYGYCPICNDEVKMREKHPNGNDVCVRGHTFASRNALPNPLGGFCQECHQPSPEYQPSTNEKGEYVNRHIHPASCIPPLS